MSQEDQEGEEREDENEIDLFEAAIERNQPSLWAAGGTAKDYVIHKIIKYFGSLVIRQDASDDFSGLYVYEKSPNASLNVLRTRV
jgi:hypothetical protein